MAFYRLVDFLERINLNMNKIETFNNIDALFDFLKKLSESNLLTELCGLIGLTQEKKIVYKKMQNISKNPDQFFSIDPYEYLIFIKNYECLAVFHSHLVGDESPSEFDVKTSENCCYPFIIYSICSEKFSIYEPHYKDYDVNILQGLREKI